jgi:uncharacterized protein
VLYLKKSQLPGAGKGLYTDAPIKKGEIIVEYLGEEVDWKTCEKRAQENKGGYVFFFNNKRCIDAFNTPEALARYANDARGLSKVKGLNNNSIYEIRKKRAYIVSTKNIPSGSEIFVDYGKEYWDSIKDNIKDEEKKKALAKKKKA